MLRRRLRGDEGLIGAEDLGTGDFGDMGEAFVVIAETHEGVGSGIFEEGGEADSGIEFAHRLEGAEVEALEDDAGLEIMTADRSVDHGGEDFRRGGKGGVGWKAFGFYIELKGALGGEAEDFVEGGDGGVRDGDLVGEVGEGVGAAIILAELGEGEGVDEGARREGWTVASPLRGEGGLEVRVGGFGLGEIGRVGDDEDVVFCDGEVEFEDVGADFDGVKEGREGVFRAEGAAPAVGVDEDGATRGLGCWGRKRRDCHEGKGRQELAHSYRVRGVACCMGWQIVGCIERFMGYVFCVRFGVVLGMWEPMAG